MKKTFVLLSFAALSVTSCKVSQMASIPDDVYTSPTEERRLAAIAIQEKDKAAAAAKQKQEQEALAQIEKDAKNPYYQDPKNSPDDYYDYKYASRINRFDSPLPGAGYYDSRYTNVFTYNQNPAFFGSSIYNSYNWMPSNQFYGYNSGLSLGLGFGNLNSGFNNFGYNPYGYGNGYFGSFGYNNFSSNYYNPFNTFGCNNFGFNNAYYAGYYNGFYNGLNGGYSGWGYFNSLDVNSGYGHLNAPRGSNGGGNSPRNTSAGMAVENESPRNNFIRSVAKEQENTPRFTETGRNAAPFYNTGRDENTPRNTYPRSNENTGFQNQQSTNINQNNNNTNPRRNERATEIRDNNTWSAPNNAGRSSGSTNTNSGGGRSSEGGGSSSPRGSGGGSNKPR